MPEKAAIRVVYFAGNSVFEGERLLKVMERIVPLERIAVSRSLESLSKELRRPVDDTSVVVALATEREELSNLLLFENLLSDRRLILVLPNDDPETLSQGHVLRPRYLSFTTGNYSDVAAVLEKMAARQDE